MTSEKFARGAGNAAKREDHSSTPNPRDQDSGKGAVEEDQNRADENGNTNMQGQLGHRDKNAELKDADSNLPG
jgi:hypothetical protein